MDSMYLLLIRGGESGSRPVEGYGDKGRLVPEGARLKIADPEWKYNHHSAEEGSREPELLQRRLGGSALYTFRCPASRACETQLTIEHLQRATDAEGQQPAEIRFRWETITGSVRPTCTCSGCAGCTDQQLLCTPICDQCTLGYAEFVRALQKGGHGNGGPAARTGNLFPITGTMRVRVQADRASCKG